MKEKLKEKILKIAIALTSTFLIIEIFGGYVFGSLALLSDAGHMFRDVFALSIALLAITLAKKLPTPTKTFGYHRAEVFAALVNGLLLFGISIGIFYYAYLRTITPVAIHSIGMFGVATVGFVVNLYIVGKLKEYGEDINIKAAYWHVLTDALSSLAIIIGATIIFFTGIHLVDPLLSMVIAFVVLFSSINLVRDSTNILLEGVPSNINVNQVIEEMESVRDVLGIHHLHVWSLCPCVNLLSAHIYTSKTRLVDVEKIKKTLNKKLEKFNILHTTFQFECKACQDKSKLKKIAHK
ncbi:MAG: cation diffusion facilitator family transporter [Candidatus Aenigmarchaeota archaeon]|nr:cation diffusion facilitator family transporter [Candidatus Aenigmarchaeota archaeon]